MVHGDYPSVGSRSGARTGRLDWSSASVVAALVLIGASACADPHYCTAVSISSIAGRVVDAQGNPASIDWVKVKGPHSDTECDHFTWSFYCRDLFAGAHRITVAAAGEVMTLNAVTRWTDETECHATGDPQTVMLMSSCPAVDAVGVHGTVIGFDGMPVQPSDVHLSLNELDSEVVACTVSGEDFSCPALLPYSARYRVAAQVGSTVIVQHVRVEARECAIESAGITFDLSALSCASDGGYNAVGGTIGRDGDSMADRVQARVDGGDLYDCIIGGLFYDCEARSATGGGHYEVSATFGDEVRTRSVDVVDDGCVPTNATIDF
jgi:hypothetical protein